MENRKFGNTGLTPSVLGFGMMRLPKRADGTIDEEWAIKTLRNAIDNGLSYVDTMQRKRLFFPHFPRKLLTVNSSLLTN